VQLFDLQADPEEVHNLALEPQKYGDTILRMNKLLNELIAAEVGVNDGQFLKAILESQHRRPPTELAPVSPRRLTLEIRHRMRWSEVPWVGKYLPMCRRISAAVVLTLLCAAPAGAADPLASLSYLVGTWNCTYNAGTQQIKYTAAYDYVMGNNWMRERDALTGGGSDVGLTTYEPKTNTWTEVGAENGRSTTVFRAKGSDGGHRVYQSVYPNALLNLTFDRVSDTKYTLHFHGTYEGKTMTSFDVCAKQP